MNAALEDLRRVPLFAGLPERALGAVSDLTREVAFADGEPLTIEGGQDCTFLLLLDGAVTVTRGGSVVRTMGAGDFVGEISLLDGRPRTATVTAMGAVRALELGRDGFLDLMERHGAVRLGIVMALADRLRRDESDVV